MNARQRVLTLILIFFVLCGNCFNLIIARQRAACIVRAADVTAAEQRGEAAAEVSLESGLPLAVLGLTRHPGLDITVTKAFNADGTEHDFTQCMLIHVNWATEKELQQLPGVGTVLAKRIMEKRMERFFADFKDLLLVPGIGEKRLTQIQPLICVAIPYVEE